MHQIPIEEYLREAFEASFDEESRQRILVEKFCSPADGQPASWPAFALPMLLQARNVHIDRQDARGCTAVLAACASGASEAVAALISSRADVTISDDDGVTAVWVAAAKGHHAILEALIAEGAVDVDAAVAKSLYSYDPI